MGNLGSAAVLGLLGECAWEISPRKPAPFQVVGQKQSHTGGVPKLEQSVKTGVGSRSWNRVLIRETALLALYISSPINRVMLDSTALPSYIDRDNIMGNSAVAVISYPGEQH